MVTGEVTAEYSQSHPVWNDSVRTHRGWILSPAAFVRWRVSVIALPEPQSPILESLGHLYPTASRVSAVNDLLVWVWDSFGPFVVPPLVFTAGVVGYGLLWLVGTAQNGP